MTKIDQLHPGQLGQPQPDAKTVRKEEGDFAKLLDQALDRQVSGPAQAAQPTAAAPASVAAPQSAQALSASQGLNALQQECVSRAERALDLLERYAGQLGRPDLSLKELEPSLAALQEEAKGLAEVADSLDPADQLHGIVQEVVMRVAAESVKFNRGDYLNA
ncbi:hypothetical protein AAU61_06110 [Desulfocarbo indianensis]|nr:hypothetical protein AAU61_06110 [Desulfocarbo indianensis]